MKIVNQFKNYINQKDLKEICFLLFVLSFIIYFLVGVSVIKRGINPDGDEHEYLLIAHSLVYDKDIDLKNNYLNQDYKRFFHGTLKKPHISLSSKEPHGYPVQNIGLPLLVSPGYFVAGRVGAVVINVFLAALLITNIFLLGYEFTHSKWESFLVTLLVAFTLPILAYSFTIMTHIAVALIFAYLFRKIRLLNQNSNFWFLGLGLAFLPWLHWKQIFLAGAFLVFLLYQYYQNRKEIPFRKIALVFFLVLVSLVLMSIRGKLLYDSYLPNAAVSSPGYWGDGKLQINGIFGQLFDRSVGLLIYNPLFVLIFAGFYYMWKKGFKKDVFWIFFTILPLYFLNGILPIWAGGYAFAPDRYIVDIIPALFIPLLFFWINSKDYIIKTILGGVSLLWGAVFVITPKRFYPLIPSKNAVFERLSYSKYNLLKINLNDYLPNLWLKTQTKDWFLLIFWITVAILLNYLMVKYFTKTEKEKI